MSFAVGFRAQNSTWVQAPGCISISSCKASNSQGMPALLVVINCTVIVRLVSTHCSTRSTGPAVLPLIPVSSQNTSYKGTKAKPKPNIATAASTNFSAVFLGLEPEKFSGFDELEFIGLFLTLLNVWWLCKSMVWRWRRDSPLQTFCTFPDFICCFFSTTNGLDQ